MKKRKSVTNLTIGPSVKERAIKLCEERDQSLSSLVNDLLRDFVEENMHLLEEGQKRTMKKISALKKLKKKINNG